MTEHIQINDVTPLVRYVASGSQSAFTYPFVIFKATDLQIWLDDTLAVSGYSVSGMGEGSGGTVTFSTAPATGTRITIRRHMPIARTTDFQADGIIRAKTLNDELDTLTAVQQQVADEVGRAIRLPVTYAGSVDATLPLPQGNRAILWNPTGSGLVNGTYDAESLATQAPLAIQAGQSAQQDAATASAAAQAAQLSRTACDTAANAVTQMAQATQTALTDAQAAAAEASSNNQSAELAKEAAEQAADNAAQSAAAIHVSQTALDTALANAASSAQAAANAAAQASTFATLSAINDFGQLGAEITTTSDYGALS